MFQKQFIFLFAFTLLLSCGEAKVNIETSQNEVAPAISETATPVVSNEKMTPIVSKDNNISPTEKLQKETATAKAKIDLSVDNMPPPTIKRAKKATEAVKKEAPKQQKAAVTTEKKQTIPAPPTPVVASFSHTNWNDLLQKHVSVSGKVNYKGFKADNAKLQAYLDLLSANPVQKSWSRNKKMAYWINAYNAFTIKLIVDNYPVASIMKINGGKPWDKKWIKLDGKTYSLNQIENDILRPTYKDARIHFAVNCAAKSCPTILNRAWTADNLNSMLNKQAKKFINNDSFNTISAKKVKISKIFEWYAADFGDNIITYLNKYSSVKIDADAKVEYVDYNWDLNKK